jgi:hypothetical protein
MHARTGALRVYLDRPWFSSGNGELLGVVFAETLEPDASLLDFVTEWGVDPIWGVNPDPQAGRLPGWTPQLKDFIGYQAHATRCFPTEFESNPSPGRTVGVVGYEVTYDKQRQLWFSDIQIDPQTAYYPFVRLALVRFQPNSLFPPIDVSFSLDSPASFLDARISQVAISDFAQLTPNRWANVTKIDHKNFNLTITGVTYYAGMEGHSGHSQFKVEVQKRWGDAEKELGWITKIEIKPEDFTVDTRKGITTWTAAVHIPESTIIHTYQLLIQEFEMFYGDGIPDSKESGKQYRDPNAPRPVERLVFADTFEL